LVDDNNKKVFIDISGEDDVKSFKVNEEDGYILQFEYGKWMIEGNNRINKTFVINYN
jgi:hypothetical protein